jgi:hypothetical protein
MTPRPHSQLVPLCYHTHHCTAHTTSHRRHLHYPPPLVVEDTIATSCRSRHRVCYKLQELPSPSAAATSCRSRHRVCYKLQELPSPSAAATSCRSRRRSRCMPDLVYSRETTAVGPHPLHQRKSFSMVEIDDVENMRRMSSLAAADLVW